MAIILAGNSNIQPLFSNVQKIKFWCLTQLYVVGVEQEVRQVEELWDELSDVPHVVSGGRLPLFLHAVKHPLCDVKPPLEGRRGTTL